jgi:endonuclease/exonuclease/phosphatase family metal-dependent hydrolase
MSHIKTIISFLFILFVFVSVSFSQRVVPSDRVVNNVNVREFPVTSSSHVCTLNKGESAELLTDTIPYWYKIKCDNAVEGYVSKAWTRIDDATSDTGGKDELVIASWNIKWFGYYSEDKHDYPAMADIVQTFDVMAVQELRGAGFNDRLDSLLAELAHRGFKYKYVFSTETGYQNNEDEDKNDYLERYAFIWDIDRVELLNPDEPYYFISNPSINNSDFRQVPIVSSFKVKSSEGFDFKIVTIHTVFSKEINHVRASEISFLHDWMNVQVFDLAIPEKDIFIIGDFNANPKGQSAHFDSIITDTTAYRVIFKEADVAGESSLRTTILVKQEINAEDHLLPVYDHLLLSKHTSYAFPMYPLTRASGIIGVVEFDQDQKWQDLGNRNDVVRAMSDHRPIWIKLDYDTEDRD